MGAELFHADGQTDMSNLPVAFRNFANAPKNERGENYITMNFRICSFPKFIMAIVLIWVR
jgi:hypothetical protein